MRKKRKNSAALALMALVTAFFLNSAVILAETRESAVTNTLTGVDAPAANASQESLQPSQEQPYDERAVKRVQFLQNIRDEIRLTQRDFYDITRNVKDADTRLTETEEVLETLSEQLANLDAQIAQTDSLIQNVVMQIGEKENELMLLYDEMEMKKVALEHQKRVLTEYLETLYEQESGVTNTVENNDEINVAKLLLSDESVGDQLQQIRYFKILEDTGHEIFETLERLMTELEEDQKSIEEQKVRLSALYERLAEEKRNLDVQRQAKANLLEQTKGEQKIYEQLLEESKKQQEQVKADLDTLRDNLQFIQEKIEELGDDFDPEDYKTLFSGETTSVYDFINSTKGDEDGFTLKWPVSASRGISAYFRDPSYKAVFGVGHNAVDIRVPQETVVRAPADGVVYKVRDNGYGYNYLIIAHKGGFMTVYGHVSEFKVEEGEKVFAGQSVALSGGTPGTKGAGLMTTGAHLHFEVMKGGKYVDPLDYLPLSYLPFDTLPEKYQARITGDKAKVRRISEEDEAIPEDQLTQVIERNARFEQLVREQQQGSSLDAAPDSSEAPAE